MNNCFKGLSFSYSRQQSIKLKKLYEEENNFKYDCVVVARFDIGQRGKEHRQKYYATNINFDTDLDMNFLYSACLNFRSTLTVTVLSILSLTTTPCSILFGINSYLTYS